MVISVVAFFCSLQRRAIRFCNFLKSANKDLSGLVFSFVAVLTEIVVVGSCESPVFVRPVRVTITRRGCVVTSDVEAVVVVSVGWGSG